MAYNLSAYDPLLKDLYEGAIRDALNNEILLLKYLETSTRTWAGRRVIFPVHLGRNTGVGARAESAVLPTAGYQLDVDTIITSAYVYGRIDLTGQVMAAGKNAFAESLAHEMSGVKTDLIFDVARQAYGDGLGTLAQVSVLSTASDTYVKVANQFAEPGQPGGRYIEQGQEVELGKLYATATFASPTVSTVTIAPNSGTTYDTITFTADISAAISASMCIYNKGAKGVEIKGLRAIVDDVTSTNCFGRTGGFLGDASLQSISRNTYKKWNANVLENSGTARVIDSNLMQRGFDKVKKSSGKMVSKVFGEYDVVSAFFDSVASDRRFATKNFDAGQEAVSYNGKTLIQDLQAPYNEMFLLAEGSLMWYKLLDFEFAADDGSILKNVSGYDRFEAFLRAYIQLGAEMCNATAVIRDIRTDLA